MTDKKYVDTKNDQNGELSMFDARAYAHSFIQARAQLSDLDKLREMIDKREKYLIDLGEKSDNGEGEKKGTD